MDQRLAEVSELRAYISTLQRDITLLLQSLQWEADTVSQQQMFSGFTKHRSDSFELCLPSADDRLDSVVTLASTDVTRIIESAANSDPLFKKGTWKPDAGAPNSEPDLRTMFTTDERRALYDAVVSQARIQTPSSHLNVANTLHENQDREIDESVDRKRQVEDQLELRDAKRRPTKYRVPNAAANYSHVLREVISSQMLIFEPTVTHSEQTGNLEEREHVTLHTGKSQNMDEKYYKNEDRMRKKRYADNNRTKHLQHHHSNKQQRSKSPSHGKDRQRMWSHDRRH